MSIAIIDGIRFDTGADGTELIGDYSYGYQSDFRHYCEDLYKTKKGNWFLVGEGNARSSYAEQVDTNTWGGGKRTRRMTDQEAYEWLEDHDHVAEIEEHFSHLIEEG